jgi:hypothetical protein
LSAQSNVVTRNLRQGYLEATRTLFNLQAPGFLGCSPMQLQIS